MKRLGVAEHAFPWDLSLITAL